MSRARTLAGAIGSDGALNVADVAGLAAVASSGSASDLSTGTLPIARIADGAVTYAKLAGDVQGDMNMFKNRIINGAMAVDQRFAGGPNTITSGGQWSCDRWKFWANSGGGSGASYTVQQSTVAPAGFARSIAITQNAAASSPSGTVYNCFAQYIEGYNVADFKFGTASASTFTLSFWVRSSLTGTFGGAFTNADQSRSYAFTYTISAANTWEYKTITVAGDQSGAWDTTNGLGLGIFWSLGVGSTYSGAAGSWASATYLSATGAVNPVTTNGATFYITGVQLEKGSTATSFDYRPYGTELALCQRYYEKSYDMGVAVGTAGSYAGSLAVVPYSTGLQYTTWIVSYKQTKRATPTVTAYSPQTGASGNCFNGSADVAASATSIGEQTCTIRNTASTSTGYFAYAHYTISSEL